MKRTWFLFLAMLPSRMSKTRSVSVKLVVRWTLRLLLAAKTASFIFALKFKLSSKSVYRLRIASLQLLPRALRLE